MAEELARYLRGWIGYFGKCQTPSGLEDLEKWFRRRLRSVIWKQWKRGTVRFAELRKRDVGKALAAKTAGSAHGPWRLANSPALAFALPNAYFDPNRRIRTRTYGGVTEKAGDGIPMSIGGPESRESIAHRRRNRLRHQNKSCVSSGGAGGSACQSR
jgi:hypothetical protein